MPPQKTACPVGDVHAVDRIALKLMLDLQIGWLGRTDTSGHVLGDALAGFVSEADVGMAVTPHVVDDYNTAEGRLALWFDCRLDRKVRRCFVDRLLQSSATTACGYVRYADPNP